MAPGGQVWGKLPKGWLVGGVRGREGFFRVGRSDVGKWWLIDSAGVPFYACCVHNGSWHQGERLWSPAGLALVRQWGFNSVGILKGAASPDCVPFFSVVDFCQGGLVLSAPGLRLPDVFDATWPKLAETRAQEVCRPLTENPALIGWVSDDNLAWAQDPGAGRPLLLQLCLSLEPGCAAYHAAWEFVLAPHGGRMDVLAKHWEVLLRNREVVRDMTRRELGIATRGYQKDNARWTREFARRYFAVTSTAVRAADANHLLMGCRFGRVEGPEVMAKCVYPAVDIAMPDWRELPSFGDMQPILAAEVCWNGEMFLQAPTGERGRRLTSVERMLRRARAGLQRLARHPAAVGYAWAQWQDGPGEQPPFARGLVHANGSEAREHTELLTVFNSRIADFRRNSAAPISL